MKGPEATPPKSRTRGQTRGQAAGAKQTVKSVLPRVPGGKALARVLFFEQQRADQAGETSTEVAVRSRSASPRSPGAKPRRERSVQPSPLMAAAEAQAAESVAMAVPVRQAWRPIGPFSIPHGQTYGAGAGSRPSVSGRISSVAIDPGDPRHILAGAGGGGVWESEDEGKTWTPRTDDQPSLSIGAVAFDPTNRSIVYAGTGEGDNASPGGTHLLGVGLLRSTDGGKTWALHARAPFERIGFYDIAIDPSNGDRLLAATTVGIFQSTNGGTSWTQRRNARTWNLSIGTLVQSGGSSTREILAACADGLFRSTNGGTTWTQVALPGGTGLQRLEVCHAPSDASVAYAFGAKASAGALWRRSAFGGAFSTAPVPQDLDVGQAWYDWFAAVAPNNPNVLYVGAIDAYKGVRSAAGQWSWTNISGKPTGDSIHPDQHAIAFSPTDPNVVYIGNDGGLYRSPNGGVAWTPLNKGLCISEIEFLAQHPQFEAWLLAGTQDNGTLRYQGDTVWFHVGDGDGGDCGVDSGSPYTCYHTYYGMGVAKSTKGGDWNSFTGPPDFVIGPPVAAGETYPKGSLFYPPVEVNGRVIAQAGNRVFISSNAGADWTRVSLPVTGGELASALAIPSATRVYAGTNAGRIFRIDFQQGSWRAPVALTRPASGYISDLLVDPTNPNRLYAAYSSSSGGGRIFRSDNAGSSWSRIDTGLPAGLPVNAIEIDPAHPDTVFCAADVGVYISRNAGAAWSPFNNGLPNALVKDLAFHPAARLLRAGTQARGVWEIAVDAATLPDVEIYLRDSTVDTGRLSPSPSGVSDPFLFGAQTFWWQCKDIKVDGPTFQRPAISDVDFEVFSDDQSLLDQGIEFASGLTNENPQRNRTVRVFVQVHNRGVNPALNLTVKVFFAAAGMTFPDLPESFWTNYPNNVLPANSPWKAIAPHVAVPSVAAGRSEIVGFEWQVPATAPGQMALLAILGADNDPLTTTERNVATLVTANKKCGLRNVVVVNPPSHAGPPVTALPLQVGGGGQAHPGPVALEADRGAASLLRGVVLSKRLAKAAKKSGWKEVKLTAEEKAELARVIEENPKLKKELDAGVAFAAAKGALVDAFEVPKGGEPLVLLVRPDPAPGYGSLIQVDESGNVLGGITLQSRKTG
jgi:photosystem II stability/assembly factor-like uncharacterized protein